MRSLTGPDVEIQSGHAEKVCNRYAPDAPSLPRIGAHVSRNPSYRTLASEVEA